MSRSSPNHNNTAAGLRRIIHSKLSYIAFSVDASINTYSGSSGQSRVTFSLLLCPGHTVVVYGCRPLLEKRNTLGRFT